MGDYDNQKQILRNAHDEQLKYKSEQVMRDKEYDRSIQKAEQEQLRLYQDIENKKK